MQKKKVQEEKSKTVTTLTVNRIVDLPKKKIDRFGL